VDGGSPAFGEQSFGKKMKEKKPEIEAITAPLYFQPTRKGGG